MHVYSVWIVYLLLLILTENFIFAKLVSLPSFSYDYSELFISAFIERPISTLDKDFHLVMILMGHKSLHYMPQNPFLMINNSESTINQWKKASKHWNRDDTKKSSESNLECQFNMDLDIPSTKAIRLPDSTSTDVGFNRNINVIRCKIPFLLQDIKANLFVNIVRNSIGIIQFAVPWESRRTGYGFHLRKHDSIWDPWAIKDSMNSLHPIVVYLCLTIVRPLEPNRMDTGITMLLENIQYHLKIGFDHIFIGIHVHPDSIHYQRYRLALNGYIRKGKVSLSCTYLHDTIDKFDDVTGFVGTMLIDDYVRYLLQLEILYLSKGLANYVAFLHSSEFLILQDSYNRVQDIIIESRQANFKEPCYYVVQSLGIPDPENSQHSFGPSDSHWTTDFFKSSIPRGPLPAWAILIVNTEYVWLIGWHVTGACSDKCVNNDKENMVTANDPSNDIMWSSEPVTHESHGYIIPWESVAVVYFYRGEIIRLQ